MWWEKKMYKVMNLNFSNRFIFLPLLSLPISLPFLTLSCKSSSIKMNWKGIRSVKMCVSQDNESNENNKRIEIRIIIDNTILYDKEKTKIEVIQPNGKIIDSSKFEISLSNNRHEIILHYNDSNLLPTGTYKLRINSTQIVEIDFVQNNNVDLSLINPEIIYLDEFNTKDMYLDLHGKNLQSIEIEQISIKNLKNKKQLVFNSDFYLREKNDERIRLSFKEDFEEGTYKIELGNTTAWFDYNRSDFQKSSPSLVSIEIFEVPDSTNNNLMIKMIKIHGRNLNKVLKNQILIENVEDLNQNEKVLFEVKEQQDKFIILKLNSSLPGNTKMKISISNREYIEFRYGTLISKATMTRSDENTLIVEFEGQNLNFIEENFKDYSFVFLNTSTNLKTIVSSFNVLKDEKNNQKLKISISNVQVGSGDFEIYLSYRNTSFISMIRSSLLEPLKPNIIKANTILENNKKRRIYLLIDTVRNGYSINENIEVEIKCKSEAKEEKLFTKIHLGYEEYKTWNSYLYLEEDFHFTNPYSSKEISIFWKNNSSLDNQESRELLFKGEIENFL